MTSSNAPLVLVLDEDRDELTDLYLFLDREGYLVATRANALDALKYLSERKPGIIVLGEAARPLSLRALVSKIWEISPATQVLVLEGREGHRDPEETVSDPRVLILRRPAPRESFAERFTLAVRRLAHRLLSPTPLPAA